VLDPVALSFAGDAKAGDQPQHVSVLLKDEAQISRAKLSGRLGHCAQHCLQVEDRSADDFEHIGRGPLLLERLVSLAGETCDLRFCASSR
jgi:hypothetical protein